LLNLFADLIETCPQAPQQAVRRHDRADVDRLTEKPNNVSSNGLAFPCNSPDRFFDQATAA